jgi:hypothetical protein
VPIIKDIRIGALTGAIVIKSKNTIAATGKTDESDSLIFSARIVLRKSLKHTPPLTKNSSENNYTILSFFIQVRKANI